MRAKGGTLMERGLRGESLADVGIIDMHSHFGMMVYAVTDTTAAGWVAVMDRIGIKAALCSSVRCLSGRPELGNDEVYEVMRAHPGRILGMATLVPRSRGWVAKEMRRCCARGFTGLKLHDAPGFAYTDEAYEPALGMANERRMPVTLHTWGQASEFEQARAIAGRYPEIRLMLAHAGIENEAKYIEIGRDFENVRLDTAVSRGPRGLVERLVRGVGAGKVVWGSDVTVLNVTQQIGKVLGSRITDEEKRRVLAWNAAEILGRIRG